MKTIQLKASKEKISIGNEERELVLTTVNLLRDTIKKQPVNGYSIEEMGQRLKLLSLFDKAKEEFKLPDDANIEDVPQEYFDKTMTVDIEDADYNALKGWVKGMRWAIPAYFIIDFVKSFD